MTAARLSTPGSFLGSMRAAVSGLGRRSVTTIIMMTTTMPFGAGNG